MTLKPLLRTQAATAKGDLPSAELVEVIQRLVATLSGGFNSTLSPEGQQAILGGLVVKWGRATGGSGDISVTFPTPFPEEVYVAGAQMVGATSATVALAASIAASNAAGITIARRTITSGTVANATEDAFWWAIGA